MPQVITSEPRAWIIRIPRPAATPRQLIHLLLSTWWRGWSRITADLARGGIR